MLVILATNIDYAQPAVTILRHAPESEQPGRITRINRIEFGCCQDPPDPAFGNLALDHHLAGMIRDCNGLQPQLYPECIVQSLKGGFLGFILQLYRKLRESETKIEASPGKSSLFRRS